MREFLVGNFARAIDAEGKLGGALGIDVEADHRKVPRKINRQRQPHIAETDNADANIGQTRQFHSFPAAELSVEGRQIWDREEALSRPFEEAIYPGRGRANRG